MKTDNKSNFNQRKGAPGDNRNKKRGEQHTPRPKKNGFFRDVPESEKKGPHQRPGGAARGTGPPGKRGPGVQKTTFFKPKQDNRSGNERRTNGHNNRGSEKATNGHKNRGTERVHNGRNNRQNDRVNNDHRNNPRGPHKGAPKNNKRPAAATTANLDQLFQSSKPEKVNYCLAPERLQAQARAVKDFQQKDREQEFAQRKEERNRMHKLLTKKTRKGQPVMQGRMELLLEKVKKSMGVQ